MSTKSDTDRFHSALVVGANGGMGATLFEILTADGHTVRGMDIAPASGQIEIDIRNPSADAKAMLGSADLVVLAVPDALAVEVGASIAIELPPSALLVDCTSVKRAYVDAIEAVAPRIGCELMSINPLFGPGLSWKGRTFAVTPIRPGAGTKRLHATLERAGIEMLVVDATTHDRMAAESQASLHAFLIAYLSSRTPESLAFAPPPTEVATRLAARVVTGAPHVYWEIQAKNPLAHGARRRLIDALEKLDYAATSGDRAAFDAMLTGAKEQLGEHAELYKKQAVYLFEHLDHAAGRRHETDE